MKIEHMAMYVQDLEAAKDFFVTWFGGCAGNLYENRSTGFRSYFVTFDGGSRLEIMNRPGTEGSGEEEKRTGYAHIAFSVGSKERVDFLTDELRNAGYEVVSGPRVTGDGYYESCITAVEGNRIEITA